MTTTVLIEEEVEIPLDLQSLGQFRCWATGEDAPERGRIDYLAGRIEVDMSPEDLFCHGLLKVELVRVLGQRVKAGALGYLFSDSTRVSSPQADLSVEPDIVFVSDEAIESGRVSLVGKSGGGPDRFVELEGSPDLIVEIVSDSSVKKDTQRLPNAYFQAGVGEFWLIDARCDPLVFRIHHRSPSGYIAADPGRDDDGYQYSPTLNCAYRLDRSRNARGRIVFDLREKEQ